MSQLPLSEGAPQAQPATRSVARPFMSRSKRPKSARQQPLLTSPSATGQSIPAPTAAIAASIDYPISPAPTPAKELPQGWVDPADSAFNDLKHCRLCGAPIKIGGLDHSLCSGNCGWVVDLQWLTWMEEHRRKRKEPEPHSPTHTDSAEGGVIDLFTAPEADGGAA